MTTEDVRNLVRLRVLGAEKGDRSSGGTWLWAEYWGGQVQRSSCNKVSYSLL